MTDRRSFIKIAGAAGIAGLAGCTGDGGESNDGGGDDSTDTTTGTTTGSPGTDTLQVAAIMPSPVDDYGWSQAESQSIQKATEQTDDVELTKIVDAVAYKDTKNVVSGLARDNDLVIADANGFLGTGTLEVSKNNSDTMFMTRNTALPPEDLPENHVAFNQHLGMVWGPMAYAAAELSETGKAGVVDSIPVLVRAHALRGAKCGAIGSEADLEIMINWINSWYDPEKTRRNAESHIENGADVLINGTNGAMPGKVAEENDIFAVGYGIDMSAAAPEGYATSVLMQPEPIFTEGFEAARDGNWDEYWNKYPNHHPWAPKHFKGEETIGLADWHDDVPESVRTKTAEYVATVDNYEVEYPEVWEENVCPDGTEFELDLPDN